jgi:hypothetical protein
VYIPFPPFLFKAFQDESFSTPSCREKKTEQIDPERNFQNEGEESAVFSRVNHPREKETH